MEAAQRPALRLVEDPLHGWDGSLSPDSLNLLVGRVRDLDERLRQATVELASEQAQVSQLERERKGQRLRLAKLEADREEKALASPERPMVEALHALWLVACKRKRPLHFADRERMAVAVKRLGLRVCLAAVAGAAYDPSYSAPRRNGSRDRFDDLELIFREYAKTIQFAGRVPRGWTPDADKIAAITGLPAEQIREWLA